MKILDDILFAGDIRDIAFIKGDAGGSGFGAYTDKDGNRVVEADILVARMGARLNSLKVSDTEYMGGGFIFSSAGAEVASVTDIGDSYRCILMVKPGQNENKFLVGDGVFCQRHADGAYKYYWRRITAIGDDYIDLSKTECAEGSHAPSAGDTVIQLGHLSEPKRQSAIYITTEGDFSPSFAMYGNIDDFTLSGKELCGHRFDPSSGEIFSYGYGSFFYGDLHTGQGISYDRKKGILNINGNITIGPGSSGLANLSEWKKTQQQIDGTQSATKTLDTKVSNVETVLSESIAQINARLDGVVENYFLQGAPTIHDEPVSSWKDEAESQGNDNVFFNHIGDTYTDIQTYIDDNTTPTAGKSWRWCECSNSGGVLASLSCGYVKSRDWYKIGTIPLRAYFYVRCYVGPYQYEAYHFAYDHNMQVVGGPPVYIKVDGETGDVYVYDNHGFLDSQTSKYEFLDENSQYIEATNKNGEKVRLHWHQIADSDAVKALLEASKAHTAADGKSRIFVNTPTPPYKEGDLWVQGSTGDIMRCKDGVNMTSGSYSASDWEVASKYTDDKVANEAKAIANAASTRLSLWAQDNVISPPEKQGIKDEYAFVVADKNNIDTKADKCGDITSDLVYITFNNACQVYVGMLYDIILSSAENVSIPNGMSLAQSKYYSARTDILNAIAEWERQEIETLHDLASSTEETVNDREYLSKTFDKLVDIEGVVMSEVVAVRNDNEEIEAFLSGSEKFRDDEHGKLILAGGIPNDDRDLDVRAKEAKTRIYENGRVDTNDIHATGGTFENITVSGIFKNPFNDNGTFVSKSDNYVNLNSSSIRGISLPTDIEQSGRKVTFVGYFIITCGTNIIVEGKGTKLYEISNEITELVAVKMSASTVQWHVLRRMPYGLNECTTVRHSGMFAGLRPKIRTITTSGPIDELDHTILIDSKSSISITLPNNAQEGQVYEFLMVNQEGTTVKHPILSNTTDIHDLLGNRWNLNRLEIVGYGIGRFIRAKDASGTLKWWFYRIR